MTQKFNCGTRLLKKTLTRPAFKPDYTGLFYGTLYFVQFDGTPDNDITTIMEYAHLACPVIQKYCQQWGNCSISSSSISFPLSVPQSYTPEMLFQWTQSIRDQNQLSSNDCIVFLNPPGKQLQGLPSNIAGFHSNTGPTDPHNTPFIWINTPGAGLTIDDKQGIYAYALSHEIAEMAVDPGGTVENPEVCDPCAGNCGVDYLDYFDNTGQWLGGSPPRSGYAFFINGIIPPSALGQCPAPVNACVYYPGIQPPPPRHHKHWWQILIDWLSSLWH